MIFSPVTFYCEGILKCDFMEIISVVVRQANPVFLFLFFTVNVL